MVRALGLGLYAIVRREIAKFVRQTERLVSALVRPALWLLIFATGMHDLLGVSIIPPYQTYTPYQIYILPGLVGLVILFQCMQSALSMVYDREAGVMQAMLVSPLPRSFLLFARIVAATVLAMLQAYAFLALAGLFGYALPLGGLVPLAPAMLLVGLMLGSIGLLVAVYSPRVENFAGLMNFVVFPMFFLSSALYPLWKLRESGADLVHGLALANPFTHAVELVRFAAYGKLEPVALAVVIGSGIIAFLLAIHGFRTKSGGVGRRRRVVAQSSGTP